MDLLAEVEVLKLKLQNQISQTRQLQESGFDLSDQRQPRHVSKEMNKHEFLNKSNEQFQSVSPKTMIRDYVEEKPTHRVMVDKPLSTSLDYASAAKSLKSRQSLSVSAHSFKPGSTMKDLISDKLRKHRN